MCTESYTLYACVLVDLVFEGSTLEGHVVLEILLRRYISSCRPEICLSVLSDTLLISHVRVPYARWADIHVLPGLPGFGFDPSEQPVPPFDS